MKRRISLMTLALGLALSGCTSLKTITFDQLEAADISFPAAVKKVAVVNNMPIFEASSGHKTISSEMEGDGKIASETFAKGLADANYFDQVIICDSVIRDSKLELSKDNLLTPVKVRQLSDDLGVDLIFSFDRVFIKAKETNVLYPDYPIPIKMLGVAVTPLIRAYIPSRQAPLLVVSKQDTIFWDIDPALTEKQVVKEASEYAAGIPVEHLLPHWVQTVRYYYDGGNIEMRDAGVYVREDNWDEANKLWNAVYQNKKGALKMKAAYNISLYYELKDDMQKASEWLAKAQMLVKPGSKEENMVNMYMLKLNIRTEKLTKLKIQMNRFDDNS